jgi:hypothetical protein
VRDGFTGLSDCHYSAIFNLRIALLSTQHSNKHCV